MNKEIWKDIPGFEGRYQASTFGRIKRLSHSVEWRGTIRNQPERILKGSKNGDGYIQVHISGGYRFKVHRLVAVTFIPNPENKSEVNHLDKNRTNNHLDNLEWATKRENTTHRFIGENRSSLKRGVHYSKDRKKWVAKIQINGVDKNLGRYDTQEEAHQAYLKSLEANGISNKYAL